MTSFEYGKLSFIVDPSSITTNSEMKIGKLTLPNNSTRGNGLNLLVSNGSNIIDNNKSYWISSGREIFRNTLLNDTTFGSNLSTSINWKDVCWSQELGIFCTVGDNGLATSSDGWNWITHTLPENGIWNGITWSSELGIFCAVAGGVATNKSMISTDGINWTTNTTPDGSWYKIIWAPELMLFCAISQSTTDNVMVSSDGVNWTINTLVSMTPISISWSAELGIFCVIQDSSGIFSYISNDGLNWTASSQSTGENPTSDIVWSPDKKMFVGISTLSTNKLSTSQDGLNWTILTIPSVNSENPTRIGYSLELGIFLIGCIASTTEADLLYSNDLITFTSINLGSNPSATSVVWSPGLGVFVVLTDRGSGRVFRTLI